MGPLPPVFLLAAIALMVALHFVVPLAHVWATSWRIVFGGAVLVVGVVLNLWADRLFTRAGTAVKPFEPSTALIESGPFSITRHPMYLGMTLILAGIALALGTLSPWLVVPVFVWQITVRFIGAEERKLEATFGRSYLEYKRRVRRWL
ncbi:MAG: methyltransferase family protein [Thiobacillaceae bacterium]